MPTSKYFGGHGAEVMREMKRRYGAEKGESVFYATATKRHQAPKQQHEKRRHFARLHPRAGGG